MTDNRTTELKPCPFCGSEATSESYYNKFLIECDRCEEYGHGAYVVARNKLEAVEAWNTRAERTCTVHIGEGEQRGWWVCDSCGDLFDTLSSLACHKGEKKGKKKLPNYCPNCGGKVIDYD